jgi:hypothetical protein
MQIFLEWTTFKTKISTKSLLKYVERDEYYLLEYGEFDSSIMKDGSQATDITDFETNYKSSANGSPIPSTSVQEQPPFAQPTYRTKLNATANILTIAPNSDADIQFLLTQERYVTGGSIVVKNAEIGDYIVAEVEDVDGVIPTPYRAALCENWPVVATYIEKQWIEVQGEYSIMKINTYPLNAKISAGLYLCLHYYAVNAGASREVAVNYHLTKKL